MVLVQLTVFWNVGGGPLGAKLRVVQFGCNAGLAAMNAAHLVWNVVHVD